MVVVVAAAVVVVLKHASTPAYASCIYFKRRRCLLSCVWVISFVHFVSSPQTRTSSTCSWA